MRTVLLLLALSPGLLADEASKASKVDELLRVMNTAVQYRIPPDRQAERAELWKRLTAILRQSTEAMQSRMPDLMSAIQKATQDFVQEHHPQEP